MGEPKLRFKADDGSEFPDWEDKTLGELFTFVFTKNKDSHINNVITNSAERGLVPQREYFDKDIAVDGNTKGYTVIRKGDFVYNPRKSASAPFGPFNIYERDEVGIVSPLYTCLTPYDDEMAPYLSWYFKTNRWHPYIVTHGAQSGARHDRVGMTVALMEGIPVLLPSLPEQRKIADFLSAVDAVIAAQQAEVDAWEQRKKGVMQKLFSQEVRFKADDGSDFPDWEEKTLGDLGEFIKGAPLSKADIAPEGNPMILYGELYTTYGEVAYEIARSTNRNVDDKYRSKIGDVLIPTSGETPEEISTATCVMKEGVILAGDLYIYRTVDEIDGRIMSYLLNHQANKAISCIAQGKSVVHVQAKELRNVTVVFPLEMGEQRKIADCLSSMDEVIQKAKDELAKWQELKKGLLQQMFV